MAQADEPLFFYTIEDCTFCNCKGEITVKSDYIAEPYEVECPICHGRGALRLDPRRKRKDDV